MMIANTSVATATQSPRSSAVSNGHDHHRAHRRERRHDDEPQQTQGGSEPRRNPLVGAMMEALKSLMPAAAKPATATGSAGTAANVVKTSAGSTPTAAATPTSTAVATTTGATPAAATSSAADIKEAALAFAHELYAALRGAAGSGGGERSHGHHHGHHHHHHGRGRVGSGYSDLGQQVGALAQQLAGGSAAPAAAATTTTPKTLAPTPVSTAATPVATTPVSSSATPVTTPPATAAVGSGNTYITINFNFGAAAAPTAPVADDKPAKPADSPLLAAFKKLSEALNPGSTGTDGASANEKLVSFLRQMAQSLSPKATEPTTAQPATGSLLNVSA